MESNNNFLDFQSSAKYFFDVSSQCFDLCVKNFNEKDLTEGEKTCVNTCFTK